MSITATPVEIVTADLEDSVHATAVVALLDGYARSEFGQERPLDAAVRETMIDKLKAHPTTLVLLAKTGAEYVGISLCFFGFSTFRAMPLLNIHDIYVREDHQGRGVGRRLLEATAAAARAAGCCKVTLEVMDANVKASELYQRCGFVVGEPGNDAHRFLSLKL